MTQVAYIYHEDYLKHRPSDYHPESPQRLQAIERTLQKENLKEKVLVATPEAATREDILLNHSPALYQEVEKSADQGYGYFDPDTYFCPETFGSALRAAGGVLEAGRLVMSGQVGRAFCAVRPPGHHAEHERSMGFCIFNNIAILAQWLRKNHQLNRIAILDWDGHHGNGTQNSFYDTDEVHFCSLHRFPFYPGSGRRDEIGSGKGQGYTLNFPMPAGADDQVYNEAVQVWAKAMDDYKPQIILISAGYDAYFADPYVGLGLTLDGFNTMARIAREVADKYAQGRIISVLEGGYVHDFLGQAVAEHIKIMME